MEHIILSETEIIIRLVVATVLGMSLGVERAMAGKTAGMRTYGLVSMGAALFVVISFLVPQLLAGIYPEGVTLDPLRLSSKVVVGVGFIGAGLIIFRDSQVRGLTTAAGLWVSAGIGLASGYGLHVVAVTATVITLILFTAMWFVEHHIRKVSGEATDPGEEL